MESERLWVDAAGSGCYLRLGKTLGWSSFFQYMYMSFGRRGNINHKLTTHVLVFREVLCVNLTQQL